MTICPACPATQTPIHIEFHVDPIGQKRYRLVRCPACHVVFSEPRDAVGADWYEKAAPIRALEKRPSPESDWRFRLFFSAQIAPGRLLDVGCGDGGFLSAAAARGWTVSGFDYEKRMIALAHARGLTDVRAEEFNAYCRSRGEAEFDAITLFDVLEHTPEPFLFFTEVKRMLKPGGVIAITMPNAERPLPFTREEHDYPPHHFTRWSPEAMRAFLNRNGFDIVRLEASGLKLRYLAEHIYFYAFMPLILKCAKLILFGKLDGTVTDLYAQKSAAASERGLMADKLVRQRIINTLKTVVSPALYAFAGAMYIFYRLWRPESGDGLFVLARKRLSSDIH